MTEDISSAASALNAPEDLVIRSARARAKATGTSVETILAAWSGGVSTPELQGPAAPIASTPPPEAAPGVTSAAGAPVTPQPSPATAPIKEPSQPMPSTAHVTPKEALGHPAVISVSAAGLKERTNSSLPRWLALAFVIVPLFGLAHLAAGGGGCREGGFELSPDRVTGAVENCDGSTFEGKGAAGGSSAYLAVGQQLFTTCAACHGANGGGGVGPELATLLNDFPSCPDQIEWVTLGSKGFTAAGKTTYGSLGKPINGGMPGFEASLTSEQIASVVSFERIRFGGGDQDTVLADCGLVVAGTSATPEGSPQGDQ